MTTQAAQEGIQAQFDLRVKTSSVKKKSPRLVGWYVTIKSKDREDPRRGTYFTKAVSEGAAKRNCIKHFEDEHGFRPSYATHKFRPREASKAPVR